MMTRQATPIASGHGVRLTVPDAGQEGAAALEDIVTVRAEPEQPGQLADHDDQRDAIEIALAHGRGQEIGQEPEPGDRRPDDDQADEDRQQAGQRDGPRLVARRQRHDRRRDDRQQRRVRPENQDPRRTEERVGDQRQDRRVQPDDRGQAGRLGVAHPGGDQDRGQDDPGEHVASPARRADRSEPIRVWAGSIRRASGGV